jgi:hypothetical protein
MSLAIGDSSVILDHWADRHALEVELDVSRLQCSCGPGIETGSNGLVGLRTLLSSELVGP